jgi:hypothetical protein
LRFATYCAVRPERQPITNATSRHCERRSRAAIHGLTLPPPETAGHGLLRSARNDEGRNQSFINARLDPQADAVRRKNSAEDQLIFD